ncbi:MAG: hypothetical protein U0637_04580 [Phycisphaerales bacterium]
MSTPRSQVRPLLIANALVAAAVVGVFIARHARAQDSVRAADIRARGEYTMVAGKSNVGPNSVVYVVDSANQEAVALRWDATKQAMIGAGYRSILNDSRAARGR